MKIFIKYYGETIWDRVLNISILYFHLEILVWSGVLLGLSASTNLGYSFNLRSVSLILTTWNRGDIKHILGKFRHHALSYLCYLHFSLFTKFFLLSTQTAELPLTFLMWKSQDFRVGSPVFMTDVLTKNICYFRSNKIRKVLWDIFQHPICL